MMNSRFRIAGAVLLLGMALGAHAQVTKGANGYTFRIKYTPGKTVSNKMTITSGMDMGGGKPMNFVMDMPLKMKCTGQKGDVYTVVTTSGPMMMNGKPQGSSKPTVTTVKVNSKGELVEGAPSQDMNFSNMKMPKEPIKVGHSWKGVINMPQGQGKVDATYKFNGIKVINGKECAVIGINMTMNGGMGKMTGTGTINVLTADGQAQNMLMNLGGTINAGGGTNGGAGGGMKMNMTVKMVRI